jgi:chitinase
MKLKEKNPKLKILISCGGWGANGQFEGIVGSEEARTAFSKNVIDFCRKWGFDGIDLDWEFPGANHKTNFGLLAQVYLPSRSI